MQYFMVRIRFSAEAWTAWVNSPHSCRGKVESAAQSFGGRLVEYWWAVSDFDSLLILEMPDLAAFQSLSAFLRSMGGFDEYKVTQLLSDEAALASLVQAAKAQ